MFNLLPKTEKDAIRREYRIRLAVVILWFSFAALLIASALGIPSYFLATEKEQAALRQVETLSKSGQASDAAEADKLLTAAKKRLAFLHHAPPSRYLYELIAKVAAIRTEGIAFTSISVTPEAGKQRVAISGVSATRTALVEFEKALSGSGLFESVELPVGSLAKDGDSEFTLNALAAL